MKNERSGKRAASIAGRILEDLKGMRTASFDSVYASWHGEICTTGELKAVCASCLTQAPNHPAKPAKRKRGKA